jgi:hypothetical protein
MPRGDLCVESEAMEGGSREIALTNGKLEQDNQNRRSAASRVWPGIDVILTRNGKVLERVRPGAGGRASAQLSVGLLITSARRDSLSGICA